MPHAFSHLNSQATNFPSCTVLRVPTTNHSCLCDYFRGRSQTIKTSLSSGTRRTSVGIEDRLTVGSA